MSKRSAFTLIELLVVVAIIALLISITMPSLKEARRISKKTVCLHNLQQIGTALQSYLHNNRDTFPPKVARLPIQSPLPPPPSPNTPPILTLPQMLRRELAGTGKGDSKFINKVFECPADQITESGMLSDPLVGGVGPRYFDSQTTSYEWNDELNGKVMHYKSIKVFQDLFTVLPKDLPMVNDFEAFHGTVNQRGSLNTLYADFEPRSN